MKVICGRVSCVKMACVNMGAKLQNSMARLLVPGSAIVNEKVGRSLNRRELQAKTFALISSLTLCRYL